MPPKLGVLSKEILVKRLQASNTPEACLEDGRNYTCQELLEQAHRANLVTDLEYDRTDEKENIVRKRYLRTMVKDPVFLDAIERYVTAASLVRAAGSKVANLFVQHAFQAGLFDQSSFLDQTFKDTTFLKYCMMPFKASLPMPGVSIREAASPPHPELAHVWQANLPLLEPLYPTLDDLRFMSWDQALTDMAREYEGALTAHVTTHLTARVTRLFQRRIADMGGYTRKDARMGRNVMTFPGDAACFASDAYTALNAGAGPSMRLPPALAALVAELRRRCGLTGSARMDRLNLTPRVFKLHMELSLEAEARGDHAWSACPIIKTSRTFAYIDERVLKELLALCGNRIGGSLYEERPAAAAGVPLLAWAFGAHRSAWLAANKAARSQHRQAAVTGSGGRKQKSRCGAGSWPDDAQEPRCRSVMMDGVALCIVLEVKPLMSRAKLRELQAISQVEQLRRFLASLSPEKHRSLVKMAEDPGRVNLSQALVKCPPLDLPHAPAEEHQERLTRASYLRRSLQTRHGVEVKLRRRQDQLLRLGISHLGGGGESWRTCNPRDFQAMLRRLAVVQDILAEEHVYDPWYARWKMLLWRRRQGVMAHYYADLIRKYAPKGAAVVLGRGDAGFAATGRGEVSVPTKAMGKAACKALGSLKTRHPKSRVQPLDETRTTATCHRCGNVLQDIKDDHGRALLGLKECRGCHEHLGGKGVDTWCKLLRTRPSEVVHHPQEEGVELLGVRGNKGRELETLKLCVVRGRRTQEHTSRVFNRDINATKNLLLVLEALLRGEEERPTHLRKQTRRARAVPQERGEEEDGVGELAH